MGCVVFEFVDPRLVNLVLGVTIGLTLSLVMHGVASAIR